MVGFTSVSIIKKKRYATFAEAEDRVRTLRAQMGIWPGIICHWDGTFTLTHDVALIKESLCP